MHKFGKLNLQTTSKAAPEPHTPKEPTLIAQLGVHHRSRVLQHLRDLTDHDRWLRFGYAIGDDALRNYVRGLHFSRDAVFGALDESARILALGHLAFERNDSTVVAEFGVSVLPHARRRGLGLALLQRAARHAVNRGATQLVMNYLPGNNALVQLAARAGMAFIEDQMEPRAYLALPAPSATTLMEETFGELIAAIDLGFRVANAERVDGDPTSA